MSSTVKSFTPTYCVNLTVTDTLLEGVARIVVSEYNLGPGDFDHPGAGVSRHLAASSAHARRLCSHTVPLVALAAPAPLPPLRHKGRRRRASPLPPLSVRPLFFRPRPPPWGSPRSRACLREPIVFVGQGLHPDPTHSCFSCTRGRLLNHRKASLAYAALSLGVTDMWRRPWPRAPVGLAARAARAK